jgi:dephospho-CoA kinase
MIKIGLTGGIGSGKTTVASIFSSFGIPIYDSDKRAKYLMNHNDELINSIKELLGEEAYTGKQLNKEYVSSQVFTNPTLLQQLNHLVHPKVAQDFNNWCNEHKNEPFVLKEAAILIESNAHKTLDKVIVVNAPLVVRVNRVMKRDNTDLESVKTRIDNQMSEKERNSYADYIINNDGKTSLIMQVRKVIEELRNI